VVNEAGASSTSSATSTAKRLSNIMHLRKQSPATTEKSAANKQQAQG
jgi:hypothetical protein